MKKSNSTYTILEITPHDNYVVLLIDDKTYKISTNAYLEDYYYPDKVLSEEELNKIIEAESLYQVTSYVSKIINYKRYTYFELKEKISHIYDINEKEIYTVLSPYIQSGIINDKSYAIEYAETKIESYSKQYILSKLKEKGIEDKYLFSQEMKEIFERENDGIDFQIKKLNQSKKNKPVNERKKYIYSYLLSKGYSREPVKRKIETFYSSLSSEEKEKERENTSILLKKELHKCYNLLVTKKYDAKTIKSKLISKLLSKGFSYDEIISAIETEQLL